MNSHDLTDLIENTANRTSQRWGTTTSNDVVAPHVLVLNQLTLSSIQSLRMASVSSRLMYLGDASSLD